MDRMATNLENLEYSGISLNMENSGNSVEPHGNIVTNKVFLLCHSNICVKRDHKTLDEGHTTFTFCCGNRWKSKFMALEKHGKLREFVSPTLWPPWWILSWCCCKMSVLACSDWFQCGDRPVQKSQVPGLGSRWSDKHPALLAMLLFQHRRHHLRRR